MAMHQYLVVRMDGHAGRFTAQSQLHRFLNCVGGYTRSKFTYSFAAEAMVPHILGSYRAYLIHVPVGSPLKIRKYFSVLVYQLKMVKFLMEQVIIIKEKT